MKISTHALAVVLTSMLVFSAPLHAQQQPATATVSGQSPEAAMAKARLDGEIAALNSGGWFGRSVAIGAVTGLIGTTITNQSPDLQAIYEKGYAAQDSPARSTGEALRGVGNGRLP